MINQLKKKKEKISVIGMGYVVKTDQLYENA
jgi:hypothetical protein